MACYKANTQIVELLLSNAQNVTNIINCPANDFRSSTSLEECLKGFLALINENIHNNRRLVQTYKENHATSKEYHKIINLLIENEGKFSKNFVENNGLSRLLAHTFSGQNKDIFFRHFLSCFCFLFRFKLNEIFFYSDKRPDLKSSKLQTYSENLQLNDEKKENYESHCKKNELELFYQLSDMEKSIDEFLLNVYVISQKVIKDHKKACLNKYIELLFILHYSGQMKIKLSKLNYLKNKNPEIYKFIDDDLRTPLSLKWHAVIEIRNSIRNLGLTKINSLNIPICLMDDLFLKNIPIVDKIQNNFSFLF